MTFNQKIQMRIEASDGRTAIADWLRSPSVGDPRSLKGTTALFDTIQKAFLNLEPVKLGDAIYVITDGGNDTSLASIRKMNPRLQQSGIRIFAMLLKDTFQTQEEEEGQSSLAKLVNHTGGLIMRFSPVRSYTLQAPKSATAAIAGDIRSAYAVTLEFPDSLSKPEAWKLELTDSIAGNKKSLTISYPHELLPCLARP